MPSLKSFFGCLKPLDEASFKGAWARYKAARADHVTIFTKYTNLRKIERYIANGLIGFRLDERLEASDAAETVLWLLYLHNTRNMKPWLNDAVEDFMANGPSDTDSAVQILASVKFLIHNNVAVGKALTKGLKLAKDAAYHTGKFANIVVTKPVITATHRADIDTTDTVLALGTLILLTPCVIERLGFRSPGTVEGSWARNWLTTYGNKYCIRSLRRYLLYLQEYSAAKGYIRDSKLPPDWDLFGTGGHRYPLEPFPHLEYRTILDSLGH